MIDKTSVYRTFAKLISKYESFLKYPGGKRILSMFSNVFDLTNKIDIWIST